MKRYELLSKENIIGELSKLDSSPACNALLNWMIKEIKTKKVHRYELLKSPEDTEKLRREWEEYCDNIPYCSSGCKYYNDEMRTGGCLFTFLNEEIEVENNE